MECFYCGKIGNLVKDFYKKKRDEVRHKHRRHSRHFAREALNFDLKNLKLFVSNDAASAETNDVNAWFLDFELQGNKQRCQHLTWK